MKLVIDVQDNRVPFVLELLGNLTFIHIDAIDGFTTYEETHQPLSQKPFAPKTSALLGSFPELQHDATDANRIDSILKKHASS